MKKKTVNIILAPQSHAVFDLGAWRADSVGTALWILVRRFRGRRSTSELGVQIGCQAQHFGAWRQISWQTQYFESLGMSSELVFGGCLRELLWGCLSGSLARCLRG